MQLDQNKRAIIESSIRDVPNFPKEGIIFKDITTLLNDAKAFGVLLDHLVSRYKNYDLDFIAGIESRGFMFAAPLAYALGVGFVPIRKKGKLPSRTISAKYDLEYGFDEVEIHTDAFRDKAGARVLLVDDLIATGGTALSSAKLISEAGGECVEACFLIKLAFLDGEAKMRDSVKTYCVMEVE